ncbi:membrane protein [Algimonas ampicilliniresistens]|jgi:Mg2+/Co2+ transporter CorB|uniref:Membrane protein n=1 Tax=Algimonas ampicilliniresistens TaxID=1298735 RepID=A0ABQ5VAE8_9PROT|nr:HlyC/CorC family transporter [Algimonas ampicilliniresistens]GLQ24042.1 membrane protein [Algimonas ampicilliniresistens]
MTALLEPQNLILVGIILMLLIFSGFFSSSETALTAASRVRMHAAEKDGDRRATIVARLMNVRERLLGGILLGNNLVNILASVLTTVLFTNLFGDSALALAAATGVMTALILIFAEVLPKTYAISQPDKLALIVARPISLIVTVLSPIVSMVQWIVNGVLHVFGIDTNASAWTAADEIKGAVDLHLQEGGVAKRARDQIYGVLEIGELAIEDVMIHRSNLSMVALESPPEDLFKEVLASGHSRLPVYSNDSDNVVGVIHVKDLLAALTKAGDAASVDVKKLLRQPWFVPETTSVVKQLRAFQSKREHFALVVDEYGALMGVITLEDILEEIVGDIQDEYDEELAGVKRMKEGGAVVRGDVAIRDLNRAMDWKLPDDEAVTIAGLVIHESQTIPTPGQTFAYHGYRFEILTRERNQIQSLRVRKTFEPDQRKNA